MTDDLVKRLREGDFYRADFYWEVDTNKADALCDQAADRIEALTAENERLREAIKEMFPLTGNRESYGEKYYRAIRIARAALGDTQ